MKQIIIVRKDLNMSPGKACAQVSHASMAFLTNTIRNNSVWLNGSMNYMTNFVIDKDVYEQWINGIFTKIVCEAKNRNHIMKAVTIAQELGLKEDEDYFLIKDCCLTELEPEETDEQGVGRTLTCIGFRPLPDDVAHQISKKYQLYK